MGSLHLGFLVDFMFENLNLMTGLDPISPKPDEAFGLHGLIMGQPRPAHFLMPQVLMGPIRECYLPGIGGVCRGNDLPGFFSRGTGQPLFLGPSGKGFTKHQLGVDISDGGNFGFPLSVFLNRQAALQQNDGNHILFLEADIPRPGSDIGFKPPGIDAHLFADRDEQAFG